MMLLERIQTTFSGWEIPNLMLRIPSWAKELSQTIKDSGAYQAVAKNSRTIRYLAEITGITCAIVYIAHIYLKIQKVQAELRKEIEDYKQTQGQLQANLTQFTANFEADKKTQKQPEKSSAMTETDLNTIQIQLQELEGQVTRVEKRVETYHEIQNQLRTSFESEKEIQKEVRKKLNTNFKTTEFNLHAIKTHLQRIEDQIISRADEEKKESPPKKPYLNIQMSSDEESHVAEMV